MATGSPREVQGGLTEEEKRANVVRLAFGGADYPFIIAHIGRGQRMTQALQKAQGAEA